MKTCKKCGASLAEDSRFCLNCGEVVDASAQAENLSEEFSFFKGKMLGSVTYKRTITDITIMGNQITMVQTLKRIFRKERKEEQSFSKSSVASIKNHTVLDFWDTLYTIIFALLGFVQPVLFLIALICLYCAYGKEIELSLSDGKKIKIPYAGSKSEAEKFLDTVHRTS